MTTNNDTIKIADSHLKPEFELCDIWIVETEMGTHYVNAGLIGEFNPDDIWDDDNECYVPEFVTAISQFVDGDDIGDVELEFGWMWRLSSPGYVDSTEWCGVFKSEYHAIENMIKYHSEFDLRDVLETYTNVDCDDVVDHYFIALAFTGGRYVPGDDDGNPEPLVNNPGGCVTDVIDGDMVREWLDDDTATELTNTVIEFTVSALMAMFDHASKSGVSSDILDDLDWQRLGTDFHFTRNGHGAGFWDGDWKLEFDNTEFDFGDVLSELAKPYGTCEIECHGWHIDDDELQDNYHGTDADLETSLFEYGLIWSNETDSDGAIRFRYPIGYNNPDDDTTPTHFSWACLTPCEHTETGFRDEFGWVDWDELFSTMGCEGFDQWLECDEFGMLVADILSHYGTENVFGSDYSHGNRIHTDDHMRCDIRG